MAEKEILCQLECVDVDTGKREVLGRFDRVLEAPNWLPDGDTILLNSGGRLYRWSIACQREQLLDTGNCIRCNNDHVLSPDGRQIALSHMCREDGKSRIFTIPVEGGKPRLACVNGDSFVHGWSPKGKKLAYCGVNRSYSGSGDICILSLEDGEERVLTTGEGFNDGPEFSPDGEYLWFNSTRSGLMQLWRMPAGGGDPERMRCSMRNDWFPHCSPDGRHIAFLSYRAEDLEPWQHLPGKQVELWIMEQDGGNARCLTELYGGQGTINVNSWSPNGKKFAFIRYLSPDHLPVNVRALL